MTPWGTSKDPLTTISISAIEHHEYCPRQCALIHVDGVWMDNRHTVSGSYAHRRADSGESRHERGHLTLRSIPLWSEALGLAGRSDIVEIGPGRRVFPVEYKSGDRHGRTADLQLCAQALCLEEMLGLDVSEGAIWYGATRRRRLVAFEHELRSQTIAVVESIRADLTSELLPGAPADDRCKSCSLEPVCLPDVVAVPERSARYVEREVFACGT